MRTFREALLGSVLFLFAATAWANAPLYDVEFLGVGFEGTALNENGDAVGRFTDPSGGVTAAVALAGTQAVALPLPEGMSYSVALDINNDGVIVGGSSTYAAAWLQPVATRWTPTESGYEVELLGTLSDDPYSIAYAVNDLGDIVGGSGQTPWYWRYGVLFTDGGPVAIDDLMQAIDINESRQVLSGGSLIYDLDTETYEDVGCPEGNWNGPALSDINNLGEVCGWVAGYWDGCNAFSVRYMLDTGWEFMSGCGTYTSATAINDLGDILFYYHYSPAGVIFEGEGPFGVGDLVDRDAVVWMPQGALDINNARQLLVSVKNLGTQETGGALMTRTGLEVPNEPPVTGIAASPLSGQIPLDVQFLSDGEWDPDGEIVAYAWDFGDGTTSTDADPMHTYTRAGTFVVTLVVTDDDGDIGSATVSIRARLLNCTPAPDAQGAEAAANWIVMGLIVSLVFGVVRQRR